MRTRSGLKVFTLLALIMLIAPSMARGQDFLWAKQSEVRFKQLSVDRSHNVYGVGFFLGWGQWTSTPDRGRSN
jgi:hypothetical protein